MYTDATMETALAASPNFAICPVICFTLIRLAENFTLEYLFGILAFQTIIVTLWLCQPRCKMGRDIFRSRDHPHVSPGDLDDARVGKGGGSDPASLKLVRGRIYAQSYQNRMRDVLVVLGRGPVVA